MLLKFLLIHESIIIKNIIQKYIMADYHEAILDISISPKNALSLLDKEKYDLVFSGFVMAGMSGTDIYKKMRGSGINQKTPMILMTSTDYPAQLRRFSEMGIQYILPIPFTSVQFRGLLHRLFPPVTNHIDSKSHISIASAIIHVEAHQFLTDVIMMSQESVICDLVCTEDPPGLKNASQITVKFPIDYGKTIMINMLGELYDIKKTRFFLYRYSKAPKERIRIIAGVIWKSFEFINTTKRTLKIDLEKASDFQEEIGELSEMHAAFVRENENLKIKSDVLHAENKVLQSQIAKLQKQLTELKQSSSDTLIKDISLDSLINEVAKRAKDPSKLTIFKKIISDNVQLREDLKK